MNQTIVLGGGCFWCTEAVFKSLKGILHVEPGYAGGTKENPTYQEVSSGTTGHAEVVKIDYDADVIELKTLLTVFFATHDPTTKDRQGNDVGSQYRSIILCDNETQKKVSEKFIRDLNASSSQGAPAITEVKMLAKEGTGKFYIAEDYHKNYYENNKKQSYCQVVINPKLKKVQKEFAELLK